MNMVNYEKVGGYKGYDYLPGQDYYNNYGRDTTNGKGNAQLDNIQLNSKGGKNMTEYEKVEPGVWKPLNDGDSIEGTLISVQNSTKYENNKIYHMECLDGKQLAIFGTTVLDDRMTFVKVGDKIKIVYKGTQKNAKGQATKIFEVYKAKA